MKEAEELDISLQGCVVTKAEIGIARKTWEADQDNLENRLLYAILLSRSQNTDDRRQAIEHLEFLLQEGYSSRDCLYSLATTYYSLGDYGNARSYAELLYREQPDSSQVKTLHQAIAHRHNEKQQEDSENAVMYGSLIGLGVCVLAAGVGALLANRKK